ncbi:NAD(P)-dependent oxidoreductase [Pseudomonas frederiksbergensis]|uniref:Oxidoreductase n=1 Tax=Pseudomonas frederiksbergensis TaxID=104087 RepID=A0A423KGF8_9PSED|nr:NAD(P)-dependent oxidoreductase [Pseudomonas frederiksbergensis]RON51868.1 oxidoreductase [Pseudomonas frederiksbergensis]
MKIGFLGLGSMGQAIAANLLKSGHEVWVWNRSPEAVQKLVGLGAKAATSADQAFSADVVFSMLADDKALRAVLLDSGLLARLKGPLIHVNLATIAVAFAEELAALHEAQGIDYIAAPVMGRPNVAALGQLNVLAAGPGPAIDLVQPLLDLIGCKTWRLGDKASSANAMKLATNFLLVSAVQAMSEAAVLVTRHDLPSAALIDLVSSTIFTGPVYQGYGALIGERRYEPAAFKASLGLKDVELIRAAAEQVAVQMPTADLIRANLLDAIAHGDGDKDLAVLAEVEERRTRAT